ncbi:DUF433 domain-containing protein [Hydrogenimonas sp.]
MAATESRPDILGGILVFKGTRVPIRNLFDYLVAGESIKDFMKDFPTVSFEQIREVLMRAEIAIEKEDGKAA